MDLLGWWLGIRISGELCHWGRKPVVIALPVGELTVGEGGLASMQIWNYAKRMENRILEIGLLGMERQ